VIFLTAIYCFAIGVGTNSLAHSDFHSSPAPSQEKFIANLSPKLFCHTTQFESSVNNFNNLAAANFKNLFSGFCAIVKATDQLFETEFSQYTSFSGNILIHHRKSDIIYPFHYFW
jgi:hypothetical protein